MGELGSVVLYKYLLFKYLVNVFQFYFWRWNSSHIMNNLIKSGYFIKWYQAFSTC